MAHTLLCDIVTPERKVYSGEGTFVVVPAVDGELGILPLHIPLVTALDFGQVRITIDDNQPPIRFAVAGGYAQVYMDKIIVLADVAEAAKDIDTTAARQAIEELKERLKVAEAGSGEEAQLQFELRWNEIKLTAANAE